MTTKDEILALLELPGLHPDTITLLNRAAAAAAKPKTTTTMNIAEELRAAALENLNGNGSRAIVKILNVLRRIPPHVFVTRAEEAQAAQPAGVNLPRIEPTLEWIKNPEEPWRWRGYFKKTGICLFLIDCNPASGTFSMGGGIIHDREDWNGPNHEKSLRELQARAEQYVVDFYGVLNR